LPKNSKNQAPKPKQIPNEKLQPLKQPLIRFGFLLFEFGDCLAFGAWSLAFFGKAMPRVTET
jgi:hypothetical protein